jgi:predicted nucleotidyltransferase
MSKADLIAVLKSSEAELRRLGVEHLALFGSRARGDNNQASDIDVLVDLAPSKTAEGPVASGRAALAASGTLSQITGLDVSLLERRRLAPPFAERIRIDVVEIF